MSHRRRCDRTRMVLGFAAALLGAIVVGCQSTTQPVSVDEPALPGKVILESGAMIDAQGGTLEAGPFKLVIPAGAVSNTTFIHMVQVVAGDWQLELSPHGTQFAVPVVLQMDAAGVPNVQTKQIHWWNPGSLEWEAQPSVVAGSVVSAELSHFSRYTLN